LQNRVGGCSPTQNI